MNAINQAIVQVESALSFAEKPLYDELEVGFRHSPLPLKEALGRYKQACEFITQDLSVALVELHRAKVYIERMNARQLVNPFR